MVVAQGEESVCCLYRRRVNDCVCAWDGDSHCCRGETFLFITSFLGAGIIISRGGERC